MYICLCKGVTEKQIRNQVLDGAVTYDEIQEHLEVGVCCGTCKDSAQEVIAETIGATLTRQNNVIEMWTPTRRAG